MTFGLFVGKKGSAKSGNWGHAGRPGRRGGSAPKSKGGGAGYSAAGGVLKSDASDANAQKLLAGLDERVPDSDLQAIYSGRTRKFDQDQETAMAADVKAQSVENIAARAGVDEELVVDSYEGWAAHAVNYNNSSVSNQKAAEAEFGVKGSAYVDEHVKRINDVRDNKIKFGKKVDPKKDCVVPCDQANRQKMLRGMYDETQAELAEMGFKPDDTITLYRGFDINLPRPGGGTSDWGEDPHAHLLPGLKSGSKIDYTGNAMGSWSLKIGTARQFSKAAYTFDHSGNKKKKVPSSVGVLLETAVPVRNILSIPTTGLGTIQELEVIVLGNTGTGTAREVNRSIKWAG